MAYRGASKPIGVVDAFVGLFTIVVTGCMVLSANTLYCNVGDRSAQVTLCGLCLVGIIVSVITLWLLHALSKHFLERWLVYAVLVAAAYAIVVACTGSYGGRSMLFAVGNIIVMPCFIRLLIEDGLFQFMLKAFITIVLVLAVSSIALWIAGPLTGLLQPNCSIMSSWGYQGRVFVSRPGWYGLLYVVQSSNDFGLVIVRNTSIFCEAPMYSYVLCAALLLERYWRSRTHPIVCALFMVTIVTTLSTTGIICVLLVLAQTIYAFTDRFSPKVKMLLRIVFVALLVAIGFLIASLFFQKLATSSGSTRLDDYRAGFMAWMNNVMVGNGFGNGDVVEGYMSAFRSDNLGFSNSPMDVLAKGGIVWLAVFIPPVVGFFKMAGEKLYGMLCFLFLWAVTIVSILPLTLFWFGIGAAAAFSESESVCKSNS